MAGDHKCPVCQATFTRPQHVARHMRSHTGDRPYKCQHCGDQFARSDLLSRHINKCHANEKPPVTTAPNQRRKGAAAACRATTSKQACDQCVQSTLPCDGANPCSKCVQRKCRCTYVKFHRQTAPVGPGHQAPVRAPSELDSPLPPYGLGARYAQSAEYQLPLAGADPSAMSLGSGLPSLYGPAQHPYAFNPGLTGYAQHDSGSSTLGAATGTSADQQEFAARYRQHAEMLRRAGVLPPASVSVAPDVNSLSAGLLYNDAMQQSRYGQQQPQASGWDRQQQSQASHQDHNGYHGSEKQVDTYDQYGYVDNTSRQQMLQRQQQQHQQQQQQQYAYYNQGHGHARQSSGTEAHDRRNSMDLSGSESSVSGSLSSAASSSAHLPYDTRSNYSSSSTRPSTAESPVSATRALPPSNQTAQSHSRTHSEGGPDDFRSAFGLMSLDDPNVLAGLTSDAQPFFSGMGLPTPTPAKERDARARALDSLFPARPEDRKDGPSTMPSTGLTPRELETRELRDFWKQYMRTPLSGGGPLGATPGLSSLTGILGEPSVTRPGPPKRGLSRVASLPSVKTPGVGLRESYDYGVQGQGAMPAPPAPAGAGRTYTGGNDDLKSYEAAVLSRRAPMTLNLQPRRGRAGSAVGIQGLTGGSPGYSGLQHDSNISTSASPELQHRAANAENVRISSANYGASRTASTLDSMDSRPSTGHMRPPSAVPDGTLRHASVFTDDGSAGSSDNDAGAARPSFKRLASQTLGPDNAKRAALAGALGDEEDDGYTTQNAYGTSSPERAIIGLPERYRRLSAPTAPTGLVGGYA